MWLEISFARTQVYMFLRWRYWSCALESSWWRFATDRRIVHWSALKVEWDIMICNLIIIYLIEEYNFFHREMFGEADLVDIFPPQIRYGPINFLIAGSKKFLDQLSELPGQQQSWVGWTQLKAFSPNSKLTYWASKAKIWYRAKKRTAWIQLPFGLGEDLVFSLIGICCIFGVLCAVSAR